MVANQIDWSRFHRKWFAIVISGTATPAVLRGFARYLNDEDGPRLRISVENGSDCTGGPPVFEILADRWGGLIKPDDRFGSDFQIHLDCSRSNAGSPQRSAAFWQPRK